ncbi:WD40 repeat domain-containing protein [Hamadaea tsunoensis]|uniref:WD40 repeat domain-containing protein n=1 Tax=Hamadaea tsunoensis TaxID=53368 RepID=UPI0003F80D6B|nr:WD40 repeat domain-containing protein [Hamadaea tsunoensis]
MPRPERPVDPGAGPAQQLAVALRELRRSAGNPTYRVLARRAHYSAATLAQAAAGERLPSLAVTLAYARACDGDAADWAVRWRAAAAQVDAAAPAHEDADPAAARPPYLGLASYGPEDADRFCGRDRLVAALVDRLARDRFVAVVGASGSGKSSLLRAGLLPAVRAEGDRWSTLLITPGAHPLRECATALAARSGGDPDTLAADLAADPRHLGRVLSDLPTGQRPDARRLLVVDQFEEVFSLCEDVSEREAFIRALLSAALAPDGRTWVVIGLRADFYAHCVRLPELAGVLQDAQLLVGPMTPDELSVAITEPAARAGLMLEKTLVATVVAEAASRPAALPFVSHALWETWRRRRGTGLFLAGYQAAGGLDGAVAQSAEDVYRRLDGEHRRAARRILLRMTALGDGTEDTRRRVARSELADDAVTASVLERLAAARLVTVGDSTVEIAHEALIRGWPTLRDWLGADRQSLRIHRHLTSAADEWTEHGHDDAFLYRGGQLDDWAARDTEALNERERGFLAASTARQAREDARRRRRLRATVGGLVAGLVTVSLLAVVAVAQTITANAQRDLAIAVSLAAQARVLLPTQPELANLLALAGLGYATTAPTVASAQAALAAPMHVARPLIGHSGAVTAVAYAPGGRTAATGGDDGTVRLWDTATASTVTVLTQHAAVTAVAFNGDGNVLASGGADGAVRLWDTGTGRPLDVLAGSSSVHALAFSPDGTVIATGDADGTDRLWDVAGRRLLTTLTGDQGPVYAVAFDPTGRSLAVGGDDNTTRIWDVAGRRTTAILRGHNGEVFAVAYSPDGTTLVTGSADGSARIWDTGTNKTVATLVGHTRVVSAVAYARDGRTIVTGSWDGTVRLWNAATHQPQATLTGHTDQVLAAALAPDGRTVLSGGRDGTARLWDMDTSRSIVTLEGHTDYVDATAFSPDRRTVATGSRDGTVRLWDMAGHGPAAVLDADAGPVLAVAFSPDGDLLAAGHKDGRIRLWNTRTHQQTGMLPGHTDGVASLGFSPDGRLLASASTDATARLWDLGTQRAIHVLTGHTDWVDAVAFPPDGRTVATASTDGTARIWDVRTGDTVTTLTPRAGHLTALAFSPDGTVLATGAEDGTAQLWDVAAQRRTTVLSGHTAEVTSVAFSPDGRWIATGSRDGTTRLWDQDGGRAILELAGHTAWVTAVAFSPDGTTLATTSWDRTARLTPVPSSWPAELCRRAGRNLTRAEWAFYVGSAPYRRLCARLPSGQGADPTASVLAYPALGSAVP